MASEKAEAEGAAAKGDSLGIIGLALLSAVAILASFGGNYLFGTTQADRLSSASPAPTGSREWNHSLVDEDMAFVSIGELTITIGGGEAARFVKLDLTLITKPKDVRLVTDSEAVLKDAFADYLRSVNPEDFENPAFYPRMKQQLARRAEIILGPSGSHGLLITEFLLR